MRLAGASPTLTAMIGLGIANHTVLTGSRVTVTLEALRLGASTATVGVLLALYAFLPMLCAVAAGRLSDRIGVRRPMLVGSAALAVGAALPAVVPGFIALFASAAMVGVSFMLFQVATQNATGELGGAVVRVAELQPAGAGLLDVGFPGSADRRRHHRPRRLRRWRSRCSR